MQCPPRFQVIRLSTLENDPARGEQAYLGQEALGYASLTSLQRLFCSPNLQMPPSRSDYEGFGCDAISSIYWLSSKPRYFIADAAAIQRISASHNTFPKPTDAYEVFDFFGRSIVTVNGPEWVRYKKITTRAFSEPSMHVVWEETMCIVKDMFTSDWSLQGNVFVLDDITDATTRVSRTSPKALLLPSAGHASFSCPCRSSWQPGSESRTNG